jgi:hypothetical protein
MTGKQDDEEEEKRGTHSWDDKVECYTQAIARSRRGIGHQLLVSEMSETKKKGETKTHTQQKAKTPQTMT